MHEISHSLLNMLFLFTDFLSVIAPSECPFLLVHTWHTAPHPKQTCPGEDIGLSLSSRAKPNFTNNLGIVLETDFLVDIT